MENQTKKQAYQAPCLERQELLAAITEITMIASGESLPA